MHLVASTKTNMMRSSASPHFGDDLNPFCFVEDTQSEPGLTPQTQRLKQLDNRTAHVNY
jgi:hypothetical protein